MQLLLVFALAVLIPLTTQQCLTASDDVRKISDKSHQALLQSELQFSADLLHAVGSVHPDQNVFFSPSSVFRAMLLAYFVSANHTEASLKTSLHLAADQDKLDIIGAYNVENYYQKLRSIKKHSYKLSSANRLFVAKNLKIQHCMKVLFAEEIYRANFEENLKGAVKKINNWVAEQTRNVIKDFLSEDAVTRDTQLVLVNAAYFKGSWKIPFSVDDTTVGKFHLNNGSFTTVPMMSQENKFKMRVDKKLGAEVLELPYTGEDISMFVLLPLKPSASALQSVLKKLDSKSLQDMVRDVNATSSSLLSVSIPKFTVEESLELTPILESMRVGDLFHNSADLSTLSESASFGFSEAIHKAKIQVDEKGSEAAAATGFISDRIFVNYFIADRPFIYILYDKSSNILLFFGIFNSPQLL